MTVCIAAVSAPLKRIITVSDMKVGNPVASIDNAIVKVRFLTQDRRWGCLFSFANSERLEAVYSHAVAALEATATPRPHDVRAAVELAYRRDLDYLAACVLKKTTMDQATFELRGRELLSTSVFNKLSKELQAIDTTVQLLVFGFDGDVPRIFSTDSFGNVADWSTLGYAAIGSGSFAANDWLFGNASFRASTDIGEIIYRLCEAKFTAETSDGVGVYTVVATFGSDGSSTVLTDDMILAARKLWKKRRTGRVPAKTLKALRGGLAVNASGYELKSFAMNKHAELRAAHGILTIELTRLIAQQLIGEKEERDIAAIQSSIAQYIEAVRVAFETWGAQGYKPDGFDHFESRLGEFIAGLQRILDSNSH